MSIASTAVRLERASAAHKGAQDAPAPRARRGMFALVERRHSYLSLRDGHHAWSTFTPCIVASVSRDGLAKGARIAGQGWPLKARDWQQITVDGAAKIANPEAVAAALVDANGHAIEYRDHAEALAAIKHAADIDDGETVPKMRAHGTSTRATTRRRAALRVVADNPPSADNGTPPAGETANGPPRRVPNVERRSREHLSRDEVMILCKAARKNRSGARDAAAIWLAFNHGLRVGELVDLRWSDVRWDERKIMVRRLKGSQSGEHPLTEQDKRFLGPLRGKRQRASDTVFAITAAGFRKMLARLDLPADLKALAVHPHMLRHACGYDMVGRADLQARAAFMGHKRLENTVRYSHLSPDQFEGLRP